MTTAYSWLLPQQYETKMVSGLGRVILTVPWTYIGSNGAGRTASRGGVYNFDPSNISPDTFIPFDEVKKSDITTWLEAALPMNDLRAALDADLAAQPADPTVVELATLQST